MVWISSPVTAGGSVDAIDVQMPEIGETNPTHVDIDLAEIDKLPDRVTFTHCPYCRVLHGWSPTDTFVSDDMHKRRSDQ